MRPIADTTLGAPAATITFSSIAADYAHLLAIIQGRGDTAVTAISLQLRLNGDTGANYDWQRLEAFGATVSGSDSVGGSSFDLGRVAGSTAPAGAVGVASVRLSSYAGTTFHKTILAEGFEKQAATTGELRLHQSAGLWRSTAAVTSLTFLLASGNFIAGTRATLYGMPS